MRRTMPSEPSRNFRRDSSSAGIPCASLRTQWADEAFASYFDVAAAKLAETGLDMVVDTTDAAGMALVDLPPGQWWVHARYEEAWSNLYWNEPITVVRGEPLPFVLNRQNATIRDIF